MPSLKYRLGPWMVTPETGQQLDEVAAVTGLSRTRLLIDAINALWQAHCAPKTAKAGKESK